MRKELFPGYNQGECRGSRLPEFFSRGHNEVEERLCGSCPVKEACLQYGLMNEVFNIWGGTTESERVDLRIVLGIPAPQIIGPSGAIKPNPQGRDVWNRREWQRNARAKKAAKV